MMEKAGYLQRTRCQALDSDGVSNEVLELHICGVRYAVRRADLIRAVSGRVMVQVEELTRNWEYYLGATAGLAQVSASGKALNIDLFGSGSFTVSLASLRAVLYGKERMAAIVRIPATSPQRLHRVAQGQQTIGATV
jgi:prophage DNA circulation protein